MDVTIKNFEEVLPEAIIDIDEADFISIDGEFTGLRNGPDVTIYDTPADYYRKIYHGSLKYLLVQVGICTFKYNEEKNKYQYKAYNFYVFPKQIYRNTNDTDFLCQTSSINFLSSVGFDFNKLFKEGIPYLTYADEETMRVDLDAKYNKIMQGPDTFNKITIPDDQKPIIEEFCKKVEAFLSPSNKESEMQLSDKVNGFVRKLLYQTIYERFPGKCTLNTKTLDGGGVVMIIQKGKTREQQNEENYQKDCDNLQADVGFSKIIRYMSAQKKLIVGHNMLLDICHIINRFYLSLPADFKEFKEVVNCCFPRLIDTKYMCTVKPFQDLIPNSALDHLLKTINEKPFNFHEAEPCKTGYGYAEGTGKAHEAGFDAYNTGCAFLTLAAYLAKSKSCPYPLPINELRRFENRCFLMRIMDYSFINFKGEEPVPSRNHVFYITFPKEWKSSDIIHVFQSYGNVHISYCGSQAAWVTLQNRDRWKHATANLAKTGRTVTNACRPYTVLTWKQRYLELNAERTPTVRCTDKTAGPPPTRKENAKRFCTGVTKLAPSTKMEEDPVPQCDNDELPEQAPYILSHNRLNHLNAFSSHEDNSCKMFEEPSWE